MKICNKCGVRKVTTEFYNHPTTIDGLQQPCKSCKVQIHTQIRKDQLSVSQTHVNETELKDLRDKLQKKQDLLNESIEFLKKLEAQLSREKTNNAKQYNEIHLLENQFGRCRDELDGTKTNLKEQQELNVKLQKEMKVIGYKLQKKEIEVTSLYEDKKETGDWVHKLEAEVKLIREKLNVELAERREVLNQLHFIQAEVPRDEAYEYRHQALLETLSVSNTLMNRILDATMKEAIQREAIKPKKQNIWQKLLNLIKEEGK